MQTTPNGGFTYPEPGDLADVPWFMHTAATAIDNALGGFVNWLPVITQGTFNYPVTLSPLTIDGGSSIGRVMRVGKQVFAKGRFSISAGNGSTGVPNLRLPYPAMELNDVVGVTLRTRGATWPVSASHVQALTATSTDVVNCGALTNSFGVGDLVLVHLCYETP
jgi:hypothetical protein